MLIAIGRLRRSRRQIAYLANGDAIAGSAYSGLPHGAIAGRDPDHCGPTCYYPKISRDADRHI